MRFFGKSAAHMELKAMPWHESIIEVELSKAKILVNTSSVGLGTDLSPIPASSSRPTFWSWTLCIGRGSRRLLADAAAAGAAAIMNGELMLLHQGAAAFELWTGQSAPLDLMRAQLDAGLAADDTTERVGVEAAAGEPA